MPNFQVKMKIWENIKHICFKCRGNSWTVFFKDKLDFIYPLSYIIVSTVPTPDVCAKQPNTNGIPSILKWMGLHNGASPRPTLTPHPGEKLYHKHAITDQHRTVPGPSAGQGEATLEENHTFLQRVESLREETAAAAEVSSWPYPTSQDSFLARTTGGPLRSYYTTEPCCSSITHIWLFKCRNLFPSFVKKKKKKMFFFPTHMQIL